MDISKRVYKRHYKGEWIAESDYDCRDDAAERVHWLNGGGKPSDTIAE